jgi:peptide/nickel transport system substrate-binding protein
VQHEAAVRCRAGVVQLELGQPVVDDQEPALATLWRYADATNTKFEVTLRQGVTFSDGEPFTADAVVASMKRFLAAPGPVAISAGPVADVTAQGTDKVLITYKSPVPYFFAIASMAQIHSFAMILSPNSLKNEASIPTAPVGVGPYKVDTANSTSAAYTYVANDKYWNKDAIKYDKVIARTIMEPAAQLAAAQSGQVTWASSIASASIAAAQSAGLKTINQQGNTVATATLENRASGPLANHKVRQALSYAIPRDDIVKAVYGGHGSSTASVGVPTLLGYKQGNEKLYGYDVAKAKQLLQDAGQGEFTVSAITQPAYSNLAQALAGAWKQVGVTLDVTVNSGTFPEYISALQSKRYDVSIAANPAIDIYSLVTFTMAPAQANNAFSVPDPQLDQLMLEAGKKPQDQQDAAYAGVTDYLDQQAVILPVGLISGVSAVSSKVNNVPSEVAVIASLVDPFSPDPNAAWYGS